MISYLTSLILVFFIMLKAASFIFFIISSKFNVKKEPSCRLPGIFMMPRALSFCYNQHVMSVIRCILWLFRYQLLITYLNEYNSESNKIVVHSEIVFMALVIRWIIFHYYKISLKLYYILILISSLYKRECNLKSYVNSER